MAKQIVTLCDACLEDEAGDVSATSIQINLNGQAHEIDLCEGHMNSLVAPLAGFLADHGQPVKQKTGNTPILHCPVSGCSKSYTSKSGLRGHIASKHPDTTAAAASDVDPAELHTCPDCGKHFEKAQGLGSHRARAHNYRTTNPQSVKRRKQKQKQRQKAEAAA